MDTTTQRLLKPAGRRWLPAALTLAVGAGLSVLFFVLVRDKEEERMKAEFTRRAGIPAAKSASELNVYDPIDVKSDVRLNCRICTSPPIFTL